MVFCPRARESSGLACVAVLFDAPSILAFALVLSFDRSLEVVFLAVLGPATIDGPALVDVSRDEPWRSLKQPFDPESRS